MTDTHQKRMPAGEPASEEASQAKRNRPDILPAHDAERKRLTHMQAVGALAGISITVVSDGYIVSRWAMSRDCCDLAAVEDLLRRQGVQI